MNLDTQMEFMSLVRRYANIRVEDSSTMCIPDS